MSDDLNDNLADCLFMNFVVVLSIYLSIYSFKYSFFLECHVFQNLIIWSFGQIADKAKHQKVQIKIDFF